MLLAPRSPLPAPMPVVLQLIDAHKRYGHQALLDRAVRELSGGWQTRTKLAALLLHDPNLLILDEPTNFLDLRTQILLERFLSEFRAGCLIVSHDREFLKRTCTHTLEMSRGQLTMFPGNVDAYLTNLEERR